MALLKILEYPDPRLRTKATPVNVVDDALRQLIDDMVATMYAAPGIGLAATQIDVHKRVIVLDISEAKDEPYCFINPEILERNGVTFGEEGCLSVPGVTEEVERAETIRVRALDRHGEQFEIPAGDLLAVCIQHEVDHLDGKLFVDYLSQLKRQRIKKKAVKTRRRDEGDDRASIPVI